MQQSVRDTTYASPPGVAAGRTGRGVQGVVPPRRWERSPEGRAETATTSLDLVIPAYNEAGRLPETLRTASRFLAELPWRSRILVIDNGSSDGTASAARAVRPRDGVDIDVIGCARPGKGAAVRRGILASEATVVGFCDADLATPLALVPAAVSLIESGIGAVIGSRHLHDSRIAGRQPAHRRLGGTAFRGLARPLVPGVRDTQCGFKFFERALAQRAIRRCTSEGFAFDVDLLRNVRREGGTIAELPVEWADAPGSTFSAIRDGISTFGAVVRLYRRSA